ncbi:MAG: hypothetical protein A2287_01645 [Candidatus Melainabacteria bacterium RIFOXYA12_FULL_32_12]|nr:MAG: hypothetical protein A2255_10740 [Candidatus Melainabacteria bacterium RIFOXYA2_FULL_32_9]OGI27212.1 MAG: hypothetical protein A2287_01645 [Candidatus Melainabacteria bacterium RIFOXYA12_FULL_32_12]
MIVYLIFLSLSLIWLLILFIGPYLYTLGNGFEFVREVYYQVFHIICHQKPERSYLIWGYQMPVCVRCFGIYLGIFLGAIIYPFFKKFSNTDIPKFKYLWFFLTPLIVDGLCQTLSLYDSPHYMRLFTGILASGGLAFYFLPLINQIYNKLKNP